MSGHSSRLMVSWPSFLCAREALPWCSIFSTILCNTVDSSSFLNIFSLSPVSKDELTRHSRWDISSFVWMDASVFVDSFSVTPGKNIYTSSHPSVISASGCDSRIFLMSTMKLSVTSFHAESMSLESAFMVAVFLDKN